MPSEPGVFPLAKQDGWRIARHTLVLSEVRPLRKSGWRGFSLCLLGGGVGVTPRPVVRGIYSFGGKDGVKPWMDIEYRGEIPCAGENAAGRFVTLEAEGLDREIFRILGNTIPPGGHLMVSYEGEDRVHRETLAALAAGVPPSVTPLGFLLLVNGFRHVKDWYLAEGGMEGPRKLWGEKAPDAAWERTFGEWTRRQLLPFLEREVPPGAREPIEAARARAVEALALVRSAEGAGQAGFPGAGPAGKIV